MLRHCVEIRAKTIVTVHWGSHQEVLKWAWPSKDRNRLLLIWIQPLPPSHAPQVEQPIGKSKGPNSQQKFPLSSRIILIRAKRNMFSGNKTWKITSDRPGWSHSPRGARWCTARGIHGQHWEQSDLGWTNSGFWGYISWRGAITHSPPQRAPWANPGARPLLYSRSPL
jgi:hypothetical protein